MDLLNGYVNMLRLFLPRAQRDDISREIAEEIHAQAADREAGLGRPLNLDEQAALLGQYGHPLLTAARYRPQQYLIGPIVFPYYWLALRVILGLVLAGHAIAALVLLAGGSPSWPAIGEAIGNTVQDAVAVVAWLTLMGAVSDRWLAKSRVLENWDPKTIVPPAHAARRVVADVTRSLDRHGPPMWTHRRAGTREPGSAFGFVVGVIVSIWWVLALWFPVLMFGPAAVALDWGPAMGRMFPALVLAQVVALAEHFVRLTRPGSAGFFRVTGLLWIAAAVGLWYGLLATDHQWIAVRATADPSATYARAVKFANYAFSIPFALAAVGGAFDAGRRIWRWFGRSGPSAAPAACLLLLAECSGVGCGVAVNVED